MWVGGWVEGGAGGVAGGSHCGGLGLQEGQVQPVAAFAGWTFAACLPLLLTAANTFLPLTLFTLADIPLPGERGTAAPCAGRL